MVERKYRLHSMPNAPCHIVITYPENSDSIEKMSIELISYSTSVCIISMENGRALVHASGTYSATTARHINRFTREFCGENLYYEIKEACKKQPYTYTTVCSVDYDTAFSEALRYMNNSFAFGNVKRYNGVY